MRDITGGPTLRENNAKENIVLVDTARFLNEIIQYTATQRQYADA
jgi:hypothetical protein